MSDVLKLCYLLHFHIAHIILIFIKNCPRFVKKITIYVFGIIFLENEKLRSLFV
jgi:hypothetical protein